MTEDDPMTFDLSAKKKKKKKKTPFDLDAALEGGQEEKVLLAIGCLKMTHSYSYDYWRGLAIEDGR